MKNRVTLTHNFVSYGANAFRIKSATKGLPLTEFEYKEPPQGEELRSFPLEPCQTWSYEQLPLFFKKAFYNILNISQTITTIATPVER